MRRRTRAAVLAGVTLSLAAGCIDRKAEFDEQVETIWLGKFERQEATAWLEAGHEFVGIDGAALLEFLTEIKAETGTESFVLLDEGGWGWVVVLRLPDAAEELQQLHA
ncbi:MAG: hypothetical protein ACREJB_16570, partial [Planctomycetaceae bacterium]